MFLTLTQVDDGKHVRLPVLEALLHELGRIVGILALAIGLETRQHLLALTLIQKLGVLRKADHSPERVDANEYGHNTLDDKDPAPADQANQS